MASGDAIESIKEKVKEAVTKILPPAEIDVEEDKNEVWKDLSRIYYKYELEEQKKAFREVLKEICEKIENNEWEKVYQKLYREERKEDNV